MAEINFTKYKYLFLDRDGVINVERPDDYVKNISEFIFINGVLDAIKEFSENFQYIFIVTNQRGIGRGIFSIEDLDAVHQYMLTKIGENGGRIDKIYYCTDINDSSINRKPNVGMAFQAIRDFPEIDFNDSIFIGNSRSDIIFANKLNMLSVLVGDKYKKGDRIYNIADVFCENLYKFASLYPQYNK